MNKNYNARVINTMIFDKDLCKHDLLNLYELDAFNLQTRTSLPWAREPGASEWANEWMNKRSRAREQSGANEFVSGASEQASGRAKGKQSKESCLKEPRAILRKHVYNDMDMANVVHASLWESLHIKNKAGQSNDEIIWKWNIFARYRVNHKKVSFGIFSIIRTA